MGEGGSKHAKDTPLPSFLSLSLTHILVLLSPASEDVGQDPVQYSRTECGGGEKFGNSTCFRTHND